LEMSRTSSRGAVPPVGLTCGAPAWTLTFVLLPRSCGRGC
jgi:hypothetical protein